MQIIADIWPYLVDMALAFGLLLAVLSIGLTTNRSEFVNQEDIHLHRRQLQGGAIFNDLLHEMRERENRRIDKLVRRLAAPDTATEDRVIYAEEIATSRSQLDAIDRMLLMRKPE